MPPRPSATRPPERLFGLGKRISSGTSAKTTSCRSSLASTPDVAGRLRLSNVNTGMSAAAIENLARVITAADERCARKSSGICSAAKHCGLTPQGGGCYNKSKANADAREDLRKLSPTHHLLRLLQDPPPQPGSPHTEPQRPWRPRAALQHKDQRPLLGEAGGGVAPPPAAPPPPPPLAAPLAPYLFPVVPPTDGLKPRYRILGRLSKLFDRPGRLVLTMPEASECFLTTTQIQNRLCFEQFGNLVLGGYDTLGVPSSFSFRLAPVMMCVPASRVGRVSSGILTTGYSYTLANTSLFKLALKGLSECTLFFITLTIPMHVLHIVLFRKTTKVSWHWRYIDPNEFTSEGPPETTLEYIDSILRDGLLINLGRWKQTKEKRAIVGLRINAVSHSCPMRNRVMFGVGDRPGICYLSPCIEVAVMLAMAGLRNCKHGAAVVGEYERCALEFVRGSTDYPKGFERSLVARLIPLDMGQTPDKALPANGEGLIEQAIRKVLSHDRCLFVRKAPRGAAACRAVRLEASKPGEESVTLVVANANGVTHAGEGKPWPPGQASCTLPHSFEFSLPEEETTERLLQASALALESLAKRLKLQGAYEWKDNLSVRLVVDIRDGIVGVRINNSVDKTEVASVTVSRGKASSPSFSWDETNLRLLLGMFDDMQSVGVTFHPALDDPNALSLRMTLEGEPKQTLLAGSPK